MQLIETIEVGAGGAASIEFTSIPQDGVDLVCVFSTRSDTTGSAEVIYTQLNSDTGANYAYVALRGNGSSASSFGGSSQNQLFIGYQPKSSDTASTFTNTEIYVSNYTSSSAKSVASNSADENNGTEAFQTLTANTYSTSSPVTTLKVYPLSGNFVQYSSASLYKITAD